MKIQSACAVCGGDMREQREKKRHHKRHSTASYSVKVESICNYFYALYTPSWCRGSAMRVVALLQT